MVALIHNQISDLPISNPRVFIFSFRKVLHIVDFEQVNACRDDYQYIEIHLRSQRDNEDTENNSFSTKKLASIKHAKKNFNI